MSGFHVPRWLDAVLSVADLAHKATHPSRWGENKPCACGKETRADCAKGLVLCERATQEKP